MGISNIEKLKETRDVEGLAKILENHDTTYDVCFSVIDALKQIGDKSAIEAIIKARLDGFNSIRGRLNFIDLMELSVSDAACRALWESTEQPIEPLGQILKDNKDENVRYIAAEELERIGDARAAQCLAQALNDESDTVRLAVVRALERIGDPVAGVALIQALNDVNKNIRHIAADALRKIGDARAVEPLTQALNDVDKGVRKSAEKALKNIQKRKELAKGSSK